MLGSAGCAPGVTSTALGLALHWPRPTLLIDADPNPTQAVLAGYLGGTVTDPGGLTVIAALHRAREDLDVLSAAMELPAPVGPDQPRWFLPGLTHPGAAAVFPPVWAALAPALHALHQRHLDVIVDVGRIGVTLPAPLLAAAQAVLLVTRSSLRHLAALRVHLPHLQQHREQVDAPGELGLMVIGAGAPYSAGEIESAFGVPVWGSLADDPPAATVFSEGADPRRFSGSALGRSINQTVENTRRRLPVTRALPATEAPR